MQYCSAEGDDADTLTLIQRHFTAWTNLHGRSCTTAKPQAQQHQPHQKQQGQRRNNVDTSGDNNTFAQKGRVDTSYGEGHARHLTILLSRRLEYSLVNPPNLPTLPNHNKPWRLKLVLLVFRTQFYNHWHVQPEFTQKNRHTASFERLERVQSDP